MSAQEILSGVLREVLEADALASVRLHPDAPWAWGRLAESLLEADGLEAAAAALRGLVETRPALSGTREERRQLLELLAALATESGDPPFALGALGWLCELEPGDVGAWVALASHYREAGKLDEALDAGSRALALREDATTTTAQSVLLTDAGRLGEAERLARRSVELDPAWGLAWSNLADTLGKAGRWEEAHDAARRATEADPSAWYAWSNLGEALSMRGEHAAAADAHEHALDLGADDAPCVLMAGRALLRVGRRDRAARALNVLRRIDSTLAAQLEGELA